MDQNTIFEKIKTIMVEQLNRKPAEVTMETSFKDMEIDSLDAVELIMSLEEEFEISISDEDAARFHDMPGLIAYIAEKIS